MSNTNQPKPHTIGGDSDAAALVVQLDITGEKITGNCADAEALGKLITHLGEANRTLSKVIAENRYENSRDRTGRPTRRKVKTQPILIEAPQATEGDFSLTFRTPEHRSGIPLVGGVEEYLPLDDLAEDTIESEALRIILRTFSLASESDQINAEELVEPLETATVRDAVRKAVAVLRANSWELGGLAQQKNRQTERVFFTQRGQARLGDALKTDLVGTYRWQVEGAIDGHKNSNNTIYFRPHNTAQGWSTVAATDVIFADASRISLDPENLVKLTIEFEPKVDRDGNPTERLTRRIVSIDKVYRSETREKLF